MVYTIFNRNSKKALSAKSKEKDLDEHIVVAVFLGSAVMLADLCRRSFFMKHKLIFKLIFCSMMAALSYVFTFFEIPLIFNISLYALPLIFIGILFGPGYGVLAGLVSGMLEQLKYGISLQTILWLLAPMTWGGLSGVLYYILKKWIGVNNFIKRIVIYFIVILISALFANIFNTIANVVFGYTKDPISDLTMFLIYAGGRLVSIPIHVAIYLPICYVVCEAIKNVMNKE